ncbi:hypothetical protein MNEG_15297 [Monoraphidium neglectum]|uniref:Uncharacterized protein n=1 Tax=Monoraphidium neglectum TaxID=145388 RepID=A0A0D2LSA3_9CHLO|nr:hypothetical protein MNEG_15297 [Monoraphidium neglectum]KIY92666.1 hypothetical protein MNEG_15297 [Monoraphidium neglectum]|eukprot:XP_013891686.1 hypothetical protein MNEG_15297 [Monoraphidium neglectum]
MDVVGCVEHYKRRHGRDDWTDVPAIAAKEVKEVFYEKLTADGISAFDGAADIIKEAQALGWGVAVASSGAPSKIARNLGSSGLAPLLDPEHIVSAAYVRRGKPAPDVYLEALRRLGAASPRSAARALVIEDAAHGLAAARAAGAYAVAVTTSLPAEALAPHADEVVGGLRDLVGRLAALRPGGTAADRPRAAAGVEAAKGVAAGAEAEAAGAVS